MVENFDRNNLIISEIEKLKDRNILVLSERIEHLNILYHLIRCKRVKINSYTWWVKIKNEKRVFKRSKQFFNYFIH